MKILKFVGLIVFMYFLFPWNLIYFFPDPPPHFVMHHIVFSKK